MHIENEEQALAEIDRLKKEIDENFAKILDIAKRFDIYTSYVLPTPSGDICISTELDGDEGEETWYSSYDYY